LPGSKTASPLVILAPADSMSWSSWRQAIITTMLTKNIAIIIKGVLRKDLIKSDFDVMN
jgi:hypothetical protein